MLLSHCVMTVFSLKKRSDRFVKKKHWGSPSGKRVEAQALTCNTNTGVRIDPQELKSTETRGVKKSLGGLNPQPPGKSDPEETNE